MTVTSRRAALFILALAISAIAGPLALAKVRLMPLAEFVQDAEFIGVVRVERISFGIPFLKRPRATATILDSWKGQTKGTVTFGAAATWVCDISDAKKGEEAIVFIQGGDLELAGRGRMPIFTREGRRLAAIWPDVRLPPAIATEAGPEPQYEFIRGIGVGDLHDAVANLVSEKADTK
jgi:hypothetical protein